MDHLVSRLSCERVESHNSFRCEITGSVSRHPEGANTLMIKLRRGFMSNSEPDQLSDKVTEYAEIDDALKTLDASKMKWVTLALEQKINYLHKVYEGVINTAEAQVSTALSAKGIDASSKLASEDWLSGPYVSARVIGTLIESLESLRDEGHTGVTAKDVYTGQNGQLAVRVLPKRLIDHILLKGFRGEVRLQPHVTVENCLTRCAEVYKNPPQTGVVSLVLGAGNVASIGLLDVIHKLYFEAQVSVLKFNPVNDYLEPHYAEILKPLIEAGFIRLVKGGSEVGKYLCTHELVEEIHITGSDRTHDAIVYGIGEEGVSRKSKDERVCEKRITSELGNVSPVIITPGSWTEREIRFQAKNIATMIYNNAGFNCNAARVLIMQAGWPHRRALLDAVREVLSTLEARPAYYPGATDRFERFMQSHHRSEQICPQSLESVEGALPIGLIDGVDSRDDEHICFREEAFCAMVATTSLEAADASSFLNVAVQFANETLWGTLNATIIVDPRTEKRISESLEVAINELKYGSVCINHWPALSYGLGSTTWGAYPGRHTNDIQSGIGIVHNTYLLEDVEKTVIRGPFVMWPHPPWFVTHKRPVEMARALMKTTFKPNVLDLFRLIPSALRG